MYTTIAEGPVETCRPRGDQWLIGVRTKPYCVEHYRCPDAFRIGESVAVQVDPHLGMRLIKLETGDLPLEDA